MGEGVKRLGAMHVAMLVGGILLICSSLATVQQRSRKKTRTEWNGSGTSSKIDQASSGDSQFYIQRGRMDTDKGKRKVRKGENHRDGGQV